MPADLTPEELELIEQSVHRHNDLGARNALWLIAEVRRLQSAGHPAVTGSRVCDRPGCLAGVIRADDGSRYCAEGHPARWVAIDSQADVLARAEKAEAEAERLRAELAEAERDRNRLRELLPLEFRAGRWAHGDGDDDPAAVITYSTEPSPETGHVGWVWWARGKMGEASSLREAKRMAVDKLRGEHRETGGEDG